MEFKEVVGTRRSIRFFEPWRPVEKEKIHAILEAVHQAPLLLETDFLRGVVVSRDELGIEKLQSIKTPTTSAQLDMAPIYIFFFADLAELGCVADGRNFSRLFERGALTPSHGWGPEFIERQAAPYIRSILDDTDRAPLRYRPAAEGETIPTVSRALMSLARNAVGIAQAYGLLAAVDQGLAVQLTSFSHQLIFSVPETWITNAAMLVGYPGESLEAGGQRPREPFEEDFFEVRYGHPFYREPAVVQKLSDARMIQDPAPFPWRFEELRGLAKKYGLPE
jgi:nitroreductase